MKIRKRTVKSKQQRTTFFQRFLCILKDFYSLHTLLHVFGLYTQAFHSAKKSGENGDG